MRKCEMCHRDEANWAMQWMDGKRKPPTFIGLGYHYRGFGLVRVCNRCMEILRQPPPPPSPA